MILGNWFGYYMIIQRFSSWWRVVSNLLTYVSINSEKLKERTIKRDVLITMHRLEICIILYYYRGAGDWTQISRLEVKVKTIAAHELININNINLTLHQLTYYLNRTGCEIWVNVTWHKLSLNIVTIWNN